MPVNFLCVGAQKAGTSSFFDIIKYHPDITMPSVKEVHYFDIDANYQKGIEWYQSFFPITNKKVIGECTPDYLLYNSVPERIRDTLGDNVKLLFILRNPIERAYSQFNFHIMKGAEFRRDFLSVINSEPVDHVNSQYIEWHNPSYYISRSLYFNQINRFSNYFKLSNMHFVLFEDLFGSEQLEHINRILDFLDLNHFDHIDASNSNQSMVPQQGIRRSILNTLRKNSWMLNTCKTFLPDRLYQNIRKSSLKQLEKRPDVLDHQLKIELNERFFKDDILKLEQLIGRDLSIWLT